MSSSPSPSTYFNPVSGFLSGETPLTINVSDGYHFRLLAALAETWGYAPDKTADALDRAIRLYLTYCLDTDDTFEGWRVDHDTVTTFPDHGDDLDALRVDVDPLSIDTSDRRNYGCGITPTMDTLLTKLIDEGYAANRSDFVRDAIEYAAHVDG
jgi:hypothetical protein